MKTTQRRVFLFGMAGMALAMGLVLAACVWGDYTGTDPQGAAIVLTLSSGRKYEIIVDGVHYDSGTYKKIGYSIILTSSEGKGSKAGTKKGEKITIDDTTFSRSVDSDAIISKGTVLDIEFADDIDDDSFFEE
jgi:hypothetical protein